MDRTAIIDIIWYFVLCFIAYVLFTYTFYVVVLLSLFYVTRLLLERGAVGTDINDSAVIITGCDSGSVKFALVMCVFLLHVHGYS